METIRSKPIGGLIQEGRYLRGRGVGGEDFGEERGVISPTGFEEELTGGSALPERSRYISQNVKTIAEMEMQLARRWSICGSKTTAYIPRRSC